MLRGEQPSVDAFDKVELTSPYVAGTVLNSEGSSNLHVLTDSLWELKECKDSKCHKEQNLT